MTSPRIAPVRVHVSTPKMLIADREQTGRSDSRLINCLPQNLSDWHQTVFLSASLWIYRFGIGLVSGLRGRGHGWLGYNATAHLKNERKTRKNKTWSPPPSTRMCRGPACVFPFSREIMGILDRSLGKVSRKSPLKVVVVVVCFFLGGGGGALSVVDNTRDRGSGDGERA